MLPLALLVALAEPVVRWPTPCVDYHLHTDAPAEEALAYERLVEDAVAAWGDHECGGARITRAGRTNDPRVGYDEASEENLNVIRWRRAWPHASSSLALTTVTYCVNTSIPACAAAGVGAILDADIEINANQPFVYGMSLEIGYDLMSTVVHEVGHALGYEHVSREASIMHPRLALGQRRALDPVDVEALCERYPHTEDPCPDPARGDVFFELPDAPDEGGCAVSAWGASTPWAPWLLLLILAARGTRRGAARSKGGRAAPRPLNPRRRRAVELDRTSSTSTQRPSASEMT